MYNKGMTICDNTAPQDVINNTQGVTFRLGLERLVWTHERLISFTDMKAGVMPHCIPHNAFIIEGAK